MCYSVRSVDSYNCLLLTTEGEGSMLADGKDLLAKQYESKTKIQMWNSLRISETPQHNLKRRMTK
jgi:hypothetical protein